MTLSTLLLMLCISLKITTTSCSKVPQGLSFPLGVSGLFTGQYFQKVPTRDSDNLVKPFMQVIIQMTRYYAQLCYIAFREGKSFLICSECRHSVRTISYSFEFERVVSEDSRINYFFF